MMNSYIDAGIARPAGVKASGSIMNK